MKTAIVLFAVLCIPSLAFSATIIVPDHYPTIQGAIDAAVNGDTVLVKPGTYMENIDFTGKAITVQSEQGVDVTVIDGNQAGSVVTCTSGEDENSVMDGFTITNGDADHPGGGMYNYSSSPTVTNCTFTNNSTTWYGGGMCNDAGYPTVTNCTFSGNDAFDGGGGMYNSNSNPTVTNCTFSENIAYLGGGMGNHVSNPTVTNCTFSGNDADDGGGGMYNEHFSSPTVTNCTFSDNSGGMYNYNSYDSPMVINCIFWDNTPYEIYNSGYGYPTVTYSCVQGGYSGTGNIDSDPLFVDQANDDFHLTFLSPCRGSGDNTAVTELYDFEGDPRVCQGTVDIGADECYRHLYCMGDFTPTGSIEGKLIGLPGTSPVGLFLGSGVLDPPLPTAWGNFHLQAPWFLTPLVPIPGDGVLVLPATIPATPPAPYDIPMQALIGLEADSLSNVCLVEVR
jgi:parallel beta-helix repeat protein